MDARVASSLLAILLVAVLGCVDAWGTVQYFNVSKTRVHEGDRIMFKCGLTLQETDQGVEHSLIAHIKKSFPGSDGWVLTTNEDVEKDEYVARSQATLNSSGTVKEIEFQIMDARVGDSGNYSCYTKRNNMTAFVDVISEPNFVELYLDGELSGKMDVSDIQHGLDVKKDEQKTVTLDQRYTVLCIVKGGNPPPAVVLSSGGQPYDGVAVTRKTERQPFVMAAPLHEANASLTWTATVKNIGMPLKCSSRVEAQPVWANFIPVVDDRQPLFDCVDKIALKDGDNDLVVSCRIISMSSPVNEISVRVYVGSERDFTVEAIVEDGPTEKAYENDERYVLGVVPIPMYFWNTTLTIKNARQIANLTEHKLEFVAKNPFDITEHVVDVEAYVSDPSSTSRMTISMAAVLFAMVLGAFWRP